MSYLKALAVLRLVAEQKDPGALGYWHSEAFNLISALDKEALVRFFQYEYEPTPVVAPWNGGSGFYPKDNQKAINGLSTSMSDRLKTYRYTIEEIRDLLRDMGFRKKPAGEEKDKLLLLCRRRLPDAVIRWLDCAYVLTSTGPIYPPILGTGANDGRLEFSNNFMQRLLEVLPLHEKDVPTPDSGKWLEASLFQDEAPKLVSAPVGQFYPGGVGGPNATQGFEADSLVNPWDYILMIEGALLFASSVARRLGSLARGRATFPFTVNASAVAEGPISEMEGTPKASRGEMWLPIWEQPATISEVAYLFAEGRAQVGRRPARTGVDFARAVASLGTDRGISAFQRYNFLNRSGRAFLAVPLDRVPVVQRPQVDLIHEADAWLDGLRAALRRAYGDAGPPARYEGALRRVDRAIFEFCLHGGKRQLQEVLIALGMVENALSTAKIREEGGVRPLHDLSLGWLSACDDNSPEFRLAAALASIRGEVKGSIGPLRTYLEPVSWDARRNRFGWSSEGHTVGWTPGDPVVALGDVLARRMLEAAMAGLGYAPLRGRIPASLGDVHLFLTCNVDDRRVADLLWGLMTLKWEGQDLPSLSDGWKPPATISRAYALLKLLFLPWPFEWNGEEVMVRQEPSILRRLKGGDVKGACEVAYRRLNASGLTPLARDFTMPPNVVRRLPTALLFPIQTGQARSLTELVLSRPAAVMA